MRLPYDTYVRLLIAQKKTFPQVKKELAEFSFVPINESRYREVKTQMSDSAQIKQYFKVKKTAKKSETQYFQDWLQRHGILQFWKNDNCILRNKKIMDELGDPRVRVVLHQLLLMRRFTFDNICEIFNTRFILQVSPFDIDQYQELFWNVEELTIYDWTDYINSMPEEAERKLYLRCFNSGSTFMQAVRFGCVDRPELVELKLQLKATLYSKAITSARYGNLRDVEQCIDMIGDLEKTGGGGFSAGGPKDKEEVEDIMAPLKRLMQGDIEVEYEDVKFPSHEDLASGKVIDIKKIKAAKQQ